MRDQDGTTDPEAIELTDEDKLEVISDRLGDMDRYYSNIDVLDGCESIAFRLRKRITVHVTSSGDGTHSFSLVAHDVPTEYPAYVLAVLGVDLADYVPGDQRGNTATGGATA